MLLFNPRQRKDGSPRNHSEGEFAFLNRVDRAYFDRIRQLLNDWFSFIPMDAQPELRRRFTSPQDWQFIAAFWEMYIHEALRRAGWKLTLHPSAPSTNSMPDFLAEKEKESFYIECVVENSGKISSSGGKREKNLYDALNLVKNSNFFLGIEVDAVGPTMLAIGSLRREIEAWLSELDPDAVSARVREDFNQGLPTRRWDRDGWAFTLEAIPIKPEARGTQQRRTLGARSGHFVVLNHRDPLLGALHQKASRYGILDRPYVIAVMDLEDFKADPEDIADALYQPLPDWIDPRNAKKLQTPRSVDAFWVGRFGARHPQVSAVLTSWNLRPHLVCREIPVLWLNPLPQRALNAYPPWPSISCSPPGNTLRRTEAPSLMHQLFGLPPDWPGPGLPFVRDEPSVAGATS